MTRNLRLLPWPVAYVLKVGLLKKWVTRRVILIGVSPATQFGLEAGHRATHYAIRSFSGAAGISLSFQQICISFSFSCGEGVLVLCPGPWTGCPGACTGIAPGRRGIHFATLPTERLRRGRTGIWSGRLYWVPGCLCW